MNCEQATAAAGPIHVPLACRGRVVCISAWVEGFEDIQDRLGEALRHSLPKQGWEVETVVSRDVHHATRNHEHTQKWSVFEYTFSIICNTSSPSTVLSVLLPRLQRSLTSAFLETCAPPSSTSQSPSTTTATPPPLTSPSALGRFPLMFPRKQKHDKRLSLEACVVPEVVYLSIDDPNRGIKPILTTCARLDFVLILRALGTFASLTHSNCSCNNTSSHPSPQQAHAVRVLHPHVQVAHLAALLALPVAAASQLALDIFLCANPAKLHTRGATHELPACITMGECVRLCCADLPPWSKGSETRELLANLLVSSANEEAQCLGRLLLTPFAPLRSPPPDTSRAAQSSKASANQNPFAAPSSPFQGIKATTIRSVLQSTNLVPSTATQTGGRARGQHSQQRRQQQQHESRQRWWGRPRSIKIRRGFSDCGDSSSSDSDTNVSPTTQTAVPSANSISAAPSVNSNCDDRSKKSHHRSESLCSHTTLIEGEDDELVDCGNTHNISLVIDSPSLAPIKSIAAGMRRTPRTPVWAQNDAQSTSTLFDDPLSSISPTNSTAEKNDTPTLRKSEDEMFEQLAVQATHVYTPALARQVRTHIPSLASLAAEMPFAAESCDSLSGMPLIPAVALPPTPSFRRNPSLRGRAASDVTRRPHLENFHRRLQRPSSSAVFSIFCKQTSLTSQTCAKLEVCLLRNDETSPKSTVFRVCVSDHLGKTVEQIGASGAWQGGVGGMTCILTCVDATTLSDGMLTVTAAPLSQLPDNNNHSLVTRVAKHTAAPVITFAECVGGCINAQNQHQVMIRAVIELSKSVISLPSVHVSLIATDSEGGALSSGMVVSLDPTMFDGNDDDASTVTKTVALPPISVAHFADGIVGISITASDPLGNSSSFSIPNISKQTATNDTAGSFSVVAKPEFLFSNTELTSATTDSIQSSSLRVVIMADDCDPEALEGGNVVVEVCDGTSKPIRCVRPIAFPPNSTGSNSSTTSNISTNNSLRCRRRRKSCLVSTCCVDVSKLERSAMLDVWVVVQNAEGFPLCKLWTPADCTSGSLG